MLLILHSLNLAQNILEDSICRQIIELPQRSVHTFGIIECDSGRPVSLVDTFGFAEEDDLVELGWIDTDVLGAVVVELIEDIVVEEALFAVDFAALVS